MKHELFCMENITIKNDYGIYLHNFTMHLYEGESIGILCSTLDEKRVLQSLFEGESMISEGTVSFPQEPQTHPSAARCFSRYFSVIGTTDKILPAFTLSDNIMLSPLHPPFYINHRKNRQDAQSLISEFQVPLDLDKPLSELTACEKILAELLRAFAQKKKVAVITKLSELMNPTELEQVRHLLDQLQPRGLTLLILVDNLDETLLHWTDELLILRNGSDIACFDSSILHYSELYNYMLTGSIDTPAIHTYIPDSPVCYDDSEEAHVTFDHITTDVLSDVSFSIDKGEILKIVCADQKSIRAFYHLLNGTTHIHHGFIDVQGTHCLFSNMEQAVKCGLYWCPEAPYKNLLMESLSVSDNLMLGPLKKAGKHVILSRLRKNIHYMMQTSLSVSGPSLPVALLSNEDRQCLAYEKILMQAPKLVIIEKPFAETIVKMNELTTKLISRLKNAGISIIILSLSISNVQMLDGDTLYMKDGCLITETDMYNSLY